MTTDLTYTERSAIADHSADDERIKRINKLWSDFLQCGADMKRVTLKAENLLRSIGYELEGLAGGQMTFGFYGRVSSLLDVTWEEVQKIMAHLRKNRDEIKSIDCAQTLIHTYQTAGLLPMPEERESPQISHESTPVTFVFHTLGTAWERIENKMRDLSKWDDMTRESVRHEIERFEKKAVELKAKL